MGIGKSAYEKRGVRCFYKLSFIETEMIKSAWSEIDNNLQYHGSGFITSLCEKYPQYAIYFTNKPRHPLNIDVAMNDTASVVLESISFLLLNYYNKEQKFDRFIGYLAMYHKDMGLVEQDIKNFMQCILNYLIKVNPILMTSQCQKAFKKYFYCIVDEFSSRMEEYRELDYIYFNGTNPRLFNTCFLCEKRIFGHPMSYWRNRQELWQERIHEWNTEIKIFPATTANSLHKKEYEKSIKSETSEFSFIENDGYKRKVSRKDNKDTEASEREITENYITGPKFNVKYIEKYISSSSSSEKSIDKEKKTVDTNDEKPETSHQQIDKYRSTARQRRREKMNLHSKEV